MDTDCNALYRYSIRHRVAKWKERGEGKGLEQRERDPDRQSQTNLSCSSSPLPPGRHLYRSIWKGRQAIDHFGFIRKQLIRWGSREEASTSIACSAIDGEGGGGKKFDGGTRETCGPNIPETFKHTATPARANWSELELDLGQLSPYPVCRRISLDERRRYSRGRIDKGKSEVEEESRRPEGWSCAPRSIIGNGNKQRPPTLLVTLLQPEGGCMHLALMNCHEHLLAQKLFETSRSKQLSFRCSLPFLFLSAARFENSFVLLNDSSLTH